MHRLRHALKSLVQELEPIGLPHRPWVRVIRKEGAKVDMPIELRPYIDELEPDFYRNLASFKQIFQIINENPDLVVRILVDAAGNPVTVGERWIWGILIKPFLNKYLAFSPELNPDDEVFGPVFSLLCDDLHTMRFLSPLFNIQMSLEEIQVTPELKLRQITSDKLEQWLNIYSKSPIGIINPLNLLAIRCGIEVTFHREQINPVEQIEAHKLTGRLVNLIQLITDQNVSMLFTEVTQGIAWKHLSWSLPPPFYGQVATLAETQSKQLKDLWQCLENSQNVTKIDLALRRLDNSMNRLNDADRLIDYWVALESLFIPETNQELNFRASLRIAAMLGQTPDERISIYKQVKESYNCRSKIVHGETLEKFDVPKIVAETRSYLQRALLLIIQSTQPFEAKKIEIDLLKGNIQPTNKLCGR